MYIKPYTRIGSYLAGLLTGYLLYKHQTESKNLSKKLVTIFWIFFSAMGLAVIYGLFFYNANTLSASRAEEIIYVTFARWSQILAMSSRHSDSGHSLPMPHHSRRVDMRGRWGIGPLISSYMDV
jgi:hypothetical protein